MTEQKSTTMRDLFPGYYRPTDEEFTQLWKSCFFVLDTNVLLNLYRYNQKTRDDFLKVLRVVENRLWIPHQVALEFQENRLNTISGQNQKLDNLRNALDNIKSTLMKELIKYPSIPHEELLEETGAKFKSFLDGLQTLEEKQLNFHENDYIRQQIDQIFNNKIGASPSKSELDNIYEDGKERYLNYYPPGYKDNTADKKKEPHLCNGLIFKREYGDLLVWKEILKQVKEADWKYIIFVTDDDKEDWWLIEKGETLGARPELTEEIFKLGITSFYMYSSDRFLKFAKKYIPEVDVEEESIEQVGEFIELAREQEIIEKTTDRIARLSPYEVEALVCDWFLNLHTNDEISSPVKGVDIICSSSLLGKQLTIGYEVKYISQRLRTSKSNMKNHLRQLGAYFQYQHLDRAYLLLVIESQSSNDMTLACASYQNEVRNLDLTHKIGLIVGTILYVDDNPLLGSYFTEIARIEPYF